MCGIGFRLGIFCYWQTQLNTVFTPVAKPKDHSRHQMFAVTNGVSVLVCLLAAILVLRLKLCKILVYRLALYQCYTGILRSLKCCTL
ncbi:hypothetical protein EMCRGX_G005837 [Ephydatia muelleri]